MENPCGKSCETCASRRDCCGCEQVSDRCPVALCCREKGHDTCATCNQRTWCPTIRDARFMPRRRKTEEEAEQASIDRVCAQAKTMVRGLTPLFWLMIAGEVLGLLKFENMFLPALILTLVTGGFMLGQAFCLGKLQSVVSRYRTAALCHGICAAVHIVSRLLEQFLIQNTKLNLLLSLPAAVFGIMAIYHTCEAHAEAVADADGELAQTWERLWKWQIGVSFAPVAILLLLIFSPALSGLLSIASLIAILVVRIWELRTLYTMINLYKFYFEE